MAKSLYIRSLKPVDLTEMYIAFLDAFSDYAIPFRLTKEQFVRKFVEKLRINFTLSAGAFAYDDTLAGFIFTTINYYDNKLTAYNGGTGVRPAYRGHKATAQMYDFLIPMFKERKIKQCVLEVLTHNKRAINSYSAIGFQKTKYYRCFKLENKHFKVRPPVIPLEIFSVKLPNWDVYESFAEQKPSFLDSSLMINDNLANETIIEAHHNGRCIGYAIYQPAFGRISQVGVSPEMRGKGVGANIIQYIFATCQQKHLTVINVEKNASVTQDFFLNLGFLNQIDQYEMILPLE
ncbi:acetyltransferase, GNAT family protein [Fulvivirga imtechensis AK7]|uniref:Acetyltransferase, GNAT family protein n=1 Tax=Fulvivirga imtechensis AK7 TaxID=1237149 RepID=L8JXC8_9BACT|nr:GNAT family N-acetyltransferase [Fulvivirga imtechensis]ELR72838.1 acetyltransferase, GNAT family protein [Fulvivirga imtechensis AK7]